MKKEILLLLMLFLWKFIFCQNWVSTTTNTNTRFDQIDFTPDSTGWAVSFSPPHIYKSTNYGQTWTLNKSLSISVLNTVNFINDSVGFVGGSDNFDAVIYKTIDKGKTWTNTNVYNRSLSGIRRIEFASYDTGYAFGSNGAIFVHSKRRGTSRWDNITPILSPTSKNVWGGHVFGPNKLLIASDQLYRKEGLNSSWDTVFTGITHDIDFINDSVGFAITDSLIIKTADGGISWDSISDNPLPANAISSIVAIDTSEIYIAGFHNEIYRSTNGGVNWTLDNTRKNNGYMTHIMRFKSDLWACNDNGKILKRKSSSVSLEENELTNSDFGIYPNPFVDFIYFKNSPSISTILVYNEAGGLIKELHGNYYFSGINLSFLTNGLYYLKVSSNKKTRFYKVIKVSRG